MWVTPIAPIPPMPYCLPRNSSPATGDGSDSVPKGEGEEEQEAAFRRMRLMLLTEGMEEESQTPCASSCSRISQAKMDGDCCFRSRILRTT